MLVALVGFALGHLVAALSSSFALVLAARVVTAPATGTFWCVGAIVATTAAGGSHVTGPGACSWEV